MRTGLTVDLEISGGRIIPEPEYTVTGTRGGLTLSCGQDVAPALPRSEAAPPAPPFQRAHAATGVVRHARRT